MNTQSRTHGSDAMSVYAPMKLVGLYILFTMGLHVLGPWDYTGESLGLAIGYMFVALCLFCLGYRSYFGRVTKIPGPNLQACKKNYYAFVSVARFGIALLFLLSVIGLLDDLLAGRAALKSLLDPGKIYISAVTAEREEVGTSIIGQIRTLFSPLTYLATVFSFFHYKRIGRGWRYFLIATIVMQILASVLLRGAQKIFFDLLLLMVSVGFLRSYFDRRMFIKFLKYGLTFFALSLLLFAVFQLSRLNAYGALDYSGNYNMKLDRDGLLFSILGDYLGLSVSLLISYLSQGYYGLSLCLQLPFEWTFGLGNSFALTAYAQQYFGISGIEESTYPFRMEAQYDWPAKMYWHTFFPWLASDITFLGAAIAMFFIGRMYARSLVDSVIYNSPLGMCMFYFLTILLVYLPANNQLMQARDMAIGFLVIFLSWLVSGIFFKRRTRLL